MIIDIKTAGAVEVGEKAIGLWTARNLQQNYLREGYENYGPRGKMTGHWGAQENCVGGGTASGTRQNSVFDYSKGRGQQPRQGGKNRFPLQ